MTHTDNTPTDPLIAALAFISAGLDHFFIAPFRWLTREPFPYFGTFIDSFGRSVVYTLLSAPFLVAAWYAAAHLVGTGTAPVSSGFAVLAAWGISVASDPGLTAMALAAAYAVWAVLPYRPRDYKNYRTERTEGGALAWEGLAVPLPMHGALSVAFAVMFLLPAEVTALPGGAVTVLAGTYLCGLGVLRVYGRVYQKHCEDGSEREFFKDGLFWPPKVAAGVAMLAAAVASLVLGVNLVTTLFYAHVALMGWTLRHIRLAVYQDSVGIMNLNPSTKLWGLVVRVPMAYAAAALVLMSGFAGATTGAPIVATFAPLVGGLGYVGWRRATSNGSMYEAMWRADVDPEEYDREYVLALRHLPMDAAQLFEPESQVSIEMTRADGAMGVCQRAAWAGSCPAADPLSDARWRMGHGHANTYARRKKAIRDATAALDEFEANIECVPDEWRERADDALERAREHLNKAERYNERVGPKKGDWLTHLVTDDGSGGAP